MESIYFVITWLCHRKCPHCYEDRFQPYYGEDLRRVVEESAANVPRIIANLPERMTFRDLADAGDTGEFLEKRGRIILAGGEVLLDPIREPVLYPAIRAIRARYRDRGGVEIIIQTTGDIVRPHMVRELLAAGVDVITVSGMDDYHEGMDREGAQQRLTEKLTRMFEAEGMEPSNGNPRTREEGRRYYHFFGATPDSWIGKLWPRGRAWKNELSQAGITDNFCNAWSGGLNFLNYRYSGSEVAIEPTGNVYPCCMKTEKAIGNLLETPLETILDSLAGNPVYEAINMGHPERMGIQHGWSVERFLEKSRVTLPSGRVYQNLCLGCDAFHREALGAQELVQLTA